MTKPGWAPKPPRRPERGQIDHGGASDEAGQPTGLSRVRFALNQLKHPSFSTFRLQPPEQHTGAFLRLSNELHTPPPQKRQVC